MPPFVRVHKEALGFHQRAEFIAVSTLLVGAARVIGRGSFGELIKIRRHRDELSGLKLVDAQIDGAAAIMLRTFCGVGDVLTLFGLDDIPKEFRDRPRAVAVENYDPETVFFEFLVNADESFRRITLKERTCLGIDDPAGKIIGACVADIEFYRLAEFGEFYHGKIIAKERELTTEGTETTERKNVQNHDEHIDKRKRSSEFETCVQNGIVESDMQQEETQSKLSCPARKWAKRAGIITFLFFLGKGLIWLGVFAAGAWYFTGN